MKECAQTLSGKHLFMPLQDHELTIWLAHGIQPLKCEACQIINDLNEVEKLEDNPLKLDKITLEANNE